MTPAEVAEASALLSSLRSLRYAHAGPDRPAELMTYAAGGSNRQTLSIPTDIWMEWVSGLIESTETRLRTLGVEVPE